MSVCKQPVTNIELLLHSRWLGKKRRQIQTTKSSNPIGLKKIIFYPTHNPILLNMVKSGPLFNISIDFHKPIKSYLWHI
jgi:hypothetical protein